MGTKHHFFKNIIAGSIAVFPDGAAALNRACCLENLGRYSDALPLYRELADRDELAGIVNGCNCLMKMGDKAGALEYATRATTLFPADPDSWIAVGNVCFSLDSWKDALDAYMHAHQIDSDNPTPPYNAALTGLRMKNMELAKRALQAFLALAPPDDARRSWAQRCFQELLNST